MASFGDDGADELPRTTSHPFDANDSGGNSAAAAAGDAGGYGCYASFVDGPVEEEIAVVSDGVPIRHVSGGYSPSPFSPELEPDEVREEGILLREWQSDDLDLVDEKNWYKLYSSCNNAAADESSADEEEELLDVEALKALGLEKKLIVRNEKDISKYQVEMINKVSSLLMIENVDACVLLIHYKWDIKNLIDEWFSDEEKARNASGLLSKGLDHKTMELALQQSCCAICTNEESPVDMSSAGCSHFYCNKCWKVYITNSIDEGRPCLSLRCPEESCNVVVNQGMVTKLASEKDKERYSRLLMLEYFESKRDLKTIKWCPALNCDCTIEILDDKNNVSCSCSFNFCWNCELENHQPVDCATVKNWMALQQDRSLNDAWILGNTKPCPDCKNRIQKNEGCLHMTCSCGHHFLLDMPKTFCEP